MKGFFALTPPDDAPKKKPKRKGPTRLDCESCGLAKTDIRSPQMDPFGDGRLGILNVGEAPGETEDTRGRQWQGKVGQILQRAFTELGFDLFRDCWNVNAANCRPRSPKGGNRPPDPHEVACCRAVKVNPAIAKFNPRLIILHGYHAVASVIGPRWKESNDVGQISRWTGWRIPDRSLGAWICPVFHPSFIARGDKELRTVWMRDLRRALECAEEPFPEFEDERERVSILEREDDITDVLRGLLDRGEVAFDIETTGLKPHAENHEIISWSFATRERAWSFLSPTSDHARLALKKVLRSRSVGKIAYNMKFEFAWIRNKMGFEVGPLVWDPMQAAHVEDSRPNITSLKFQAYVRYGVPDYSLDVEPFLRAKDENDSNSENRIRELISTPEGCRTLLLYGGLDSLLTMKIADDQRARLDVKGSSLTSDAYYLMHDGVLALADAEATGLRVARELGETAAAKLTRNVERLERHVKSGKLFRLMEKRFGRAAKLSSNPQLATVLYEDMKIKPPKTSAKTQRGSTDKGTLEKLDVPEIKDILEIRKLKKVRDTYLMGFIREACGEFVHPFFNLHLVRTFRSSSDSPNFQNIPIRDEFSAKVCRGVLFPHRGQQLMELDYSGVEVRVSACYHKDPTMINYILDPTTDMHLDMAKEIFEFKSMTKSDKAHKHIRNGAKNGFVFPQFYGDYYVNCAENLAVKWAGLPHGKWRGGEGMKLTDGSTIGDHLVSVGIKSYDAFVEHVKRVEDDFWNRRFRVYTGWKRRWYARYQSTGEFEMLTGFRVSGVMSRNEVLNYPIQGSAFHCLLWLFIELNKVRRQEKWRSRPMGQIHDSIVWTAVPEEVPAIVETTNRLVAKLRELWSWLIVPLEVEFEIADVDAPWSEKKALPSV